MLTTRDINLLRDIFVIKDEFKKFTAKVLERLDAVMGELKAIREEQMLVSGRVSEHSDFLEDQETRLVKLEKHISFPTG